MTTPEGPQTLSEVLDQVVTRIEGERISLGDILEALGERSYGPVLVVVALISMLPPISLTPGLPMVTGTVFLLLSVQLLFLRLHPWLPKRLLGYSFTREQLTRIVNRVRPWAERIGKILRPRLTFLFHPPVLNLIALLCLGLALLTYPLAILPAGENIPAAAVLFLGLALTTRDGWLVVLGLVITGGSLGLLLYFWPVIARGMGDLFRVLGF